MSEVMISDRPQPVCLEQLRKALSNIVGLDEITDLIDTTVIVIKNELISEVSTDLNQEKKEAQKSGGTLKTAGVLAGLWALFCSSHPVGWIIGGVTAITVGTIKKTQKAMNHYETYLGEDTLGKTIYVLMYDNVSLKLDTIIYPEFVKSVNIKNPIRKIQRILCGHSWEKRKLQNMCGTNCRKISQQTR